MVEAAPAVEAAPVVGEAPHAVEEEAHAVEVVVVAHAHASIRM